MTERSISEQDTETQSLPERKRISFNILHRQGMVIVFITICAVAYLMTPDFLSLGNIRNVLRQVSIIGLLAAGETFVILIGGIDLSIGAVVSLSGCIAAGFQDRGMFVGVLAGLLTGAAIGLVNGVAVAKGRIQPFVVTLGTMSIAQGLALLYTGGFPIFDLSDSFNSIGSGSISFVPIPVAIFFLVYVIAYLILRYSKFGRYTYSLGGNENATRLSGVNVDRQKILVYTVCGLLAGLGGVVLAARLGIGMPTMGTGYELQAIAAVVIGGTALSGGRGGVVGTILGTLTLGVIYNVLNLLNVTAFYQYIVIGAIIVVAALINELSKRYGG
jgi:ribose/xylose/arabinose/galactoside ABC-type transport system permease subunit